MRLAGGRIKEVIGSNMQAGPQVFCPQFSWRMFMLSKARKSLKGLVLVAFVGLATVSVGAQQQNAAPLSPARSQALQSQLKAIDQDRAGFLDELLNGWAPYVDPRVYDLRAELGPIATKIPAWQLYGASLVGDFHTMLRILRGEEGAGPYINAFAEPQPKTALDPFLSPADALGDLGSTSDSLVFTPIAPCRMVDTRLSTLGILGTGATRSFNLTTSGFSKDQGSVLSCPGLPVQSPPAWAVNITVTAYNGNGWLIAWPFGGTEPIASVANYGVAPYAIASGQVLTGCYLCTDDILVKAANAATHVIIDVTGYFQAAKASSATVTRIAGTVINIPDNFAAHVTGGACPAGTRMIGGEVDHGAGDLAVGEFTEADPTTMTFWMINHAGAPANVTAYSRCLDTPVKIF